jgi:MFS family permease
VKDLAGVEFSFYSMGVVALVGFFLTLFFLPESTVARLAPSHSAGPLRWIFESGRIRGIYLFRLCFAIGIGLTWAFLPLYGHDVMRLTSSHIGLVISLNILISTILQTPCGMLADRFSKEGLVIIGGCLAAAALSLIPFTRNFLELVSVNILWGVAGGFAMPALAALAVEEGKKLGGMGALMSIFVMCHSIGMIIGPLVAGAIAEFVDIAVVFFAGSLTGLIGVGGVVYFQRRPSVQG